MKRRDFVSGSILASTLAASKSCSLMDSTSHPFFELRRYQPMWGSKRSLLNKFLKEAAIAAWNRMGISPIGAFTVRLTVNHFSQPINEPKMEPVIEYSGDNPEIFLLLPHISLESFIISTKRLFEDKKFLEKGAPYINATISNPAYVRYESSLLSSFYSLPVSEILEGLKTNSNSRVFEIRISESHSEKAAMSKKKMFNEGGEIEIMKKNGIHPIFFGESLSGSSLPNLIYMLSFEDMNARTASWESFRNSPEWKQLSEKSEYQDKVSKITDIILSPTSYSQI